MSPRQLQMYAVVAIMWGASFYWLTITTPEYGWGASVSFRAFIACALLVVLALVTRRKLDFQHEWKNLAVLGFFSVGVNLGGMNFALPRNGTALTGILCSTIPLFSLLIEWVWHGKRPTPSMLAGLVLGFAGVVVLIGFSARALDANLLQGVAGSMLASCGFAFGGSWAKAKLPHLGSYEQTIGTFLFGGAWTLPLLLVAPVVVWPPSLHATMSLLIVAATASSLAYILYFKLIDEIGATKALTTEFWVPVVAVLVGWLALDEVITLAQLVGAGMILLGCFLVMGLAERRLEIADTVAH